LNIIIDYFPFSANALQLLLELLGTYTKETASKARVDASKYSHHKCFLFDFNSVFVFL